MASRSHALRLLAIALFGAMMAACATAPSDYRNISPRWQIANSPLPVPSPKAKPRIRTATKWAQPAPRVVRASTKAPQVYRVRAGDSVYGLARRFKVPASQIIAWNKLYKPYHLNKGQLLRLSEAPKPVVRKAAAKPAEPAVRRHTVKRGEALYAIARKANVSADAVIARNNLKKPYTLRPGQVLILPAVARPGATPAGMAYSTLTGRGTFIWPANGKVISRYGVKADGLRNDGINISGRAGDPIYAAATGQVIYAGDSLRAFGNLVLIRHASGMVSAYAHASRLYVKEGDAVEQGQPIGQVGKTGNVSEPQLHFELRRNSEAIDPMRYLGRVQMAAAGR